MKKIFFVFVVAGILVVGCSKSILQDSAISKAKTVKVNTVTNAKPIPPDYKK
jgi:uncharacterized protein YceK